MRFRTEDVKSDVKLFFYSKVSLLIDRFNCATFVANSYLHLVLTFKNICFRVILCMFELKKLFRVLIINRQRIYSSTNLYNLRNATFLDTWFMP